MTKILHILTRPEDGLAEEVVAIQSASGEAQLKVADLTVGSPDYSRLLEEIFEADSIQTW